MNAESDILFIPSGYANGAMSLSDESTVMYFSTSNLEESMDDDYRFDSKILGYLDRKRWSFI